MNVGNKNKSERSWRDVLFEVIFEPDTRAGKWFDVELIVCILLSVAVVMLDSVSSVHERHGDLLYGLEWLFRILFTVEYVLWLPSVDVAAGCAVGFFGIVDLPAIRPVCLRLPPVTIYTRKAQCSNMGADTKPSRGNKRLDGNPMHCVSWQVVCNCLAGPAQLCQA